MAFGVVRNAYDPTRSASGSSGGTGSGMAANFATVGIGEDTGGSIRGPAAVNNLVGLRPTLPLVSRFGMMPARPTTDTLGPIARSVKDAAIVLGVIASYDANDPVTVYAVGQVPGTYTQFLAADGLRGAAGAVECDELGEPEGDRSRSRSHDAGPFMWTTATRRRVLVQRHRRIGGGAVRYAVAEGNLRLGRILIADCVNRWPLTRVCPQDPRMS